MANSPDWLGLERKISAGKLIEQAAEEVGVSLEAAKAWMVERTKARGVDDDSLRLTSAYAIQVAVAKLVTLAEGSQRLSSSSTDGASSESYESTDLKAAQVLLRAGLEIRKLIKPKDAPAKGSGTSPADLFDRTGPNPWTFKQPD